MTPNGQAAYGVPVVTSAPGALARAGAASAKTTIPCRTVLLTLVA